MQTHPTNLIDVDEYRRQNVDEQQRGIGERALCRFDRVYFIVGVARVVHWTAITSLWWTVKAADNALFWDHRCV